MITFKNFSLALAIALGSMACKHDEHDIPLDIDYSAAYVVNGMDNNLSVIDLATNKVSETIQLDNAVAPHHIYLSPDKKTLAVAITSTDLSGGHGGHGHNHGGSSNYKVLILDTVTGLITKTIELTKMPHNAIFNSTGTELWIGQSDANVGSVLIYNTTDWTLKQTIPVGSSPSEVTFSTDGSTAFVANTGSASVTVINASTKAIRTTLPVGVDPVGAWPASNGKMYVDNEASKTISIIDVASLVVTETLNLGYKPGYVAYHSETNELWVTDATNGKAVIYERVSNTWAKKAEVVTGADAHAITFSPDLKQAYITNQGLNTVTVLNATTYAKVQDITVGRMPNGIVVK
jgi:YVTN family beta-propeller protein